MPNKTISAEQIYKQQNSVLHRGFVWAGKPYNANKLLWLETARNVCGRSVESLSELTLWERSRMINGLIDKGYKLFNPYVPKHLRPWKKGDENKNYQFIQSDDKQIRMALGLYAEMGYDPKGFRTYIERRFGVTHEKFLTPDQKNALVTELKIRAQQNKKKVQHA